MHISDGVLSNPVCIGGYVAALGMTGITLRRIDVKEISQISVVIAVESVQ